MRRTHVAAAAVGLAVLAGACGSGDLPKLPGRSASAAGEAAAMRADMSLAANVRYELAEGVTTDVDRADAYKFGETSKDAVAKLAKALGVGGEVRADGDSWTVNDNGKQDTSSLFVGKQGGVFSMSSNASVGVSSGGCSVPPVEPGAPDAPVASDQPMCDPAPTTTTTIDPNAPTREEAQRIATDALRAGGVNLDDTKATVDSFDGGNATVHFQGVVDNKTVDGFDMYVSVGPDKRVTSASGFLERPDNLGTYDLATLTRAVERLNESSKGITTLEARDDVSVMPVEPDGGAGGGTAPTEPTEPTVVKLTSVEVGLLMQTATDGSLWLVPAYAFGTGDGGRVLTEAADDKYIETAPTTTAPSPSDGGGNVGVPAPGNCAHVDGDITADVCADPSPAKVGERVTFRITASDNDRAFANGPCYDGVTVEYGDNGPGDVRCEACTASLPDGPGKTSVERVHTYEKAGTYTAKFTIRSGADCGASDPKDSATEVSLTVKVA